MVKKLTESVREAIRVELEATGHNNVDVAALVHKWGDFPQWEVRRAVAEIRGELQRKELADSGAFRIRTLDPQPISKRGVEAVQAGWMRPLKLTYDSLPPINPSVNGAAETILVISDVHAPEHDPHAMDVMYQIGRSLPLNRVIINGDLFDIASLSRFTPRTEQHLRWVDERREAVATAVEIRQNFPDVPIDFIPGNHDVRPLNWLNANALPLQGLLGLEEWLGIQDLGFNVHPDGTIRLADGKLLIKHGTRVSQHAGWSVKKEMDSAGVSVVMGHVHRRAIIEATKLDAEYVGVELGCLCSLKPSYANPEDVVNWQQGFAVITLFRDEYACEDFEIELVRIKNGQAFFRGQKYNSRVGGSKRV